MAGQKSIPQTREGESWLLSLKPKNMVNNECIWFGLELDAAFEEIKAQKAALREAQDTDERVQLSANKAVMDQDIYGGGPQFANYVTSIAANEDEADDDDDVYGSADGASALLSASNGAASSKKKVIAPQAFLNEVVNDVSFIFPCRIIFKDIDQPLDLSILSSIIMQEEDPLKDRRAPRIGDRLDEYRLRAYNRQLSPERADVFADGEDKFYL